MGSINFTNKNKIYILVILAIFLIMGTGYAVLTSSLGIGGNVTVKKDKTIYNMMARNAQLDTSVNFSSSTVNAGIYEMNSTKDDTNPVYYYRGAVTNNNVKFANFCWKIVRTTQTGGVKLVYNGVVGSDGSCNNTGTDSQIGTSPFNTSHTSVAYSGYMYGNVYESSKYNMQEFVKSNYIGYDVSTGTAKYQDMTNAYFTDRSGVTFGSSSSPYAVLGTSIDASEWAEKYTLVTNTNGLRYTRFGGVSGYPSYGMNYIYYGDAIYVYYVYLSKADDYQYLYTPEEVLNQMTTESSNSTNSTIKETIDTWYKNNMVAYTSKLEDTDYCNDRSITTYGGWKDANSATSPYLYYGARNRLVSLYKPSVSCSNNDKFTTSTNAGNGKLEYPVGLLTADETVLAGSKYSSQNTNYYLYTGQNWWTMSPYLFFYDYACGFAVQTNGSISYNYESFDYGVRPAISLKAGTKYVSGDGTAASPFVVE